jgi:hypothetical protein
VSQRVAQVHDERIEVVGQAAGGGFLAGVLELAHEDLEAELAVLDAGRLVECLSVGEADAVLF